jgi:hypothetical protein
VLNVDPNMAARIRGVLARGFFVCHDYSWFLIDPLALSFGD